MCCMENFQITTPSPSLGLCFSECWVKWNISIRYLEKLTKWPPKLWVSAFPSVNGNGTQVLVIMNESKNGCHLVNISYASYRKLSNYQPQKVWVSGFLSVDRNGIMMLAIMKISKNGCHFINICHTENFQITEPLKVWVAGFPRVNSNGNISISHFYQSLV